MNIIEEEDQEQVTSTQWAPSSSNPLIPEERKTLTYMKPCTDDSDVSSIQKINSIDRVIQEEYDLLDEPGDIYPAEAIVSLDSVLVNKDQDDFR